MVKETPFVWMDGKMVPWKDATVHVLTHALHYGSAVFEGIRFYKTDRGPAVFRLGEHLTRFLDSAKILKIPMAHDLDALTKACVEIVRSTGLAEGYIRPLAFRGYGDIRVNPLNCPSQCIIASYPWGAYLGEEGLKKGIRVKISSFTRMHANVMMTKAKVSGNYVNSILAVMEAREDGYDEAVMMAPNGLVAEGPGENIFLVKNGVVKTPHTAEILEGVTRDTVITLLQEAGRDVREEPVSRDQLYSADEVFFVGTAAEVTPIREVDRRTVGKGVPGELTMRLQAQYMDVVHGRVPNRHGWLTFC